MNRYGRPDTPASRAFAKSKLERQAKNKKAHKKVKVKSVNWWKKKAWTVFSKWIRSRDKNICYTCRRDFYGKITQAGHFISRSHTNTLFDEQNVHCQCYYCNVMERGNIGEYALRLREELGDEGFQDLLRRGKQTKQFTVEELQGIIEKYQKTAF